MGVARELGLEAALECELLIVAAEQWPNWVQVEPGLAKVPSVAGLPAWLRVADCRDADLVLLGLVRLGCQSRIGGQPASAVVAWSLLPGACSLAHRLGGLSPRIDEIVASQLWLEIRSFPWDRLQKVAANVLANTRNGVLVECGVATRTRRVDRTWAQTVPCGMPDLHWATSHERVRNGAAASTQELDCLLAEADDQGVLEPADRLILDRLLIHADTAGARHSRRGMGGLLGDDLVAMVARDVGVSSTTVRRRARRAVLALSEAHRTGRIAA